MTTNEKTYLLAKRDTPRSNPVAASQPSPNLSLLKLFAMFAMVIDHVHMIGFGRPYFFLTLIGLSAFPLFAFILSYNYCFHTSNKRHYLLRLLAFALISQIPFQWAIGYPFNAIPPFNIFFTLSLGMLILHVCEKIPNITLGKIFICLICIGLLAIEILTDKNYSFMIDAGFSGIALIPAIYALQRINFLLGWMLITASLAVLDGNLCAITIGTMAFAYLSGYIKLPLAFMRRHKYFFYLFYPLHLVIIRLVFLANDHL